MFIPSYLLCLKTLCKQFSKNYLFFQVLSSYSSECLWFVSDTSSYCKTSICCLDKNLYVGIHIVILWNPLLLPKIWPLFLLNVLSQTFQNLLSRMLDPLLILKDQICNGLFLWHNRNAYQDDFGLSIFIHNFFYLFLLILKFASLCIII
jgi:hypothetical protein